MARTKLLNGEVVALTAAEETARDAEEAQAVVDREAEEAAKVARQERLGSVKTKLEALGLTTEEVKEAFGI